MIFVNFVLYAVRGLRLLHASESRRRSLTPIIDLSFYQGVTVFLINCQHSWQIPSGYWKRLVMATGDWMIGIRVCAYKSSSCDFGFKAVLGRPQWSLS